MASNDLEVIEEIERALRVKLRRMDESDFNSWPRLIENLSKNYVADELGKVTALRLRNLALTKSKIDFSLFLELSELNTLDLGWSHLTDIDVLKEFKQLKTLDLRNNKLTNIDVLKELDQLNSLCLNNNKLNNIDGLKELKQLYTLDLGSNQLNDISVLGELEQLRTLVLRSNKLSDISVLKKLKQLHTLDLGKNRLSNIDIIKELNQLRELNLQENQITNLSALESCIHLTHLDCRGNRLTHLPDWITKLPPETVYPESELEHGFALDKINVGNNPLIHPPPEIIKQGREAIRAYFQSLKEETVRLHEAKVLLIGEGMAGKTSLLKRLQGLDFDKKESQTHGINVLSLSSNELPGFGQDDECRLHFWDFGGQEIMHASHRFFMSNRSLYILVLDSRTDSRKFHWLRHIEKYGGKSPLIVTMNKIDINPSYNIEQKSINKQFPWIENRFFRISCKNNEGLPELIRSIAAAVPNTPLFGMEISKSWLAIRTELEQATEAQNYINQDQFIAICEKHGVNDKISRITLLKLLNDLGTVLFFENLPLTDIYVLDPHWVTVGVYKIINSEKTKDGILRETDLEFILNEEKIRCDEYDPAKEKQFTYTRAELRYLIQIMQEFKLCYLYSESEHLYILPNQLPKEPEEEPRLEGVNLLRFIMEYDFLPSSLFSRLMVRMKKDIQDRRQQWRYGMLLDNNDLGVQAIIKMEEQNNRIMITITGGLHSKRQYLSIIRHSIAGLGFQELVPKELVPLPGYQNAFADYKALLGYERAGKNEYFDGILSETFSVSELLDSVVSKEERSKEERIMVETKIDIHDVGNPQIHQNVNQSNTQMNTQNQSVDLHNQFKEAQALFRNLKADILDEAEIEIEDEKEKKRVANELNKAEKAMTEAEEAAAQGKEPDAATKSRLEGFFNSLADKSSRLGKALEFVDQGTQKVQKLARTYNSIAGNVGLPTVPPLLLGKEDK
ncbi:MAG: COR domain-containing protein [Candidatus Electrothrix communis]|nr:MAG: COR domain-containing protein [Candidatus Electrothrix communis]